MTCGVCVVEIINCSNVGKLREVFTLIDAVGNTRVVFVIHALVTRVRRTGLKHAASMVSSTVGIYKHSTHGLIKMKIFW